MQVCTLRSGSRSGCTELRWLSLSQDGSRFFLQSHAQHSSSATPGEHTLALATADTASIKQLGFGTALFSSLSELARAEAVACSCFSVITRNSA